MSYNAAYKMKEIFFFKLYKNENTVSDEWPEIFG